MKIQILGSGCKSCQRLYENAQAAAQESGLDFEMEKIQDFQQISAMGVMKTPALAIDGKVKFSGKVMEKDEIKNLYLKKIQA